MLRTHSPSFEDIFGHVDPYRSEVYPTQDYKVEDYPTQDYPVEDYPTQDFPMDDFVKEGDLGAHDSLEENGPEHPTNALEKGDEGAVLIATPSPIPFKAGGYEYEFFVDNQLGLEVSPTEIDPWKLICFLMFFCYNEFLWHRLLR